MAYLKILRSKTLFLAESHPRMGGFRFKTGNCYKGLEMREGNGE